MFLELSGFSRTKTMSTVRNVIIKNKSTKYMVWIPYDIVYSEVSTWFHNRLYIFIAQCPLTWVGRGVGFSVWYWSGGTFGQTETPALASQLWVDFEKNGWFPVQISDDFVILISWYLLQIDALWVKKKKKKHKLWICLRVLVPNAHSFGLYIFVQLSRIRLFCFSYMYLVQNLN